MSRIIDILNAIKNSSSYDSIACSRAESILKSIANNNTNLIDVDNLETNDLLTSFDITEIVKGKTISLSSYIDCSNVVGAGGRIRIDITNSGTTTSSFGNIIAGANKGLSKVENLVVPNTSSKVLFMFQTFSSNTGKAIFSEAMCNEGTTIKTYIEPIKDARSRYEELLLDIKNGTTPTLTAQTRLEEILVAIANDTLDTYLTGKNLFNTSWEYGSISATTGTKTNSTTKLRTITNISVSPSETYTIALNQSSNKFGILNIHAYSKTGVWLGSRTYFNLEALGTRTTTLTFTAPSDVYSIAFVLTVYGDDTATINIEDLSYTNIMINVGSSASEYAKYSFEELEGKYIDVASYLRGE